MAEYEIFYEGNLSTRCVHLENQDVIFTDAPKDNQGEGKKFSPTDLLAAAWGSCIMTIMGIHARRLKVDLKGSKARVVKIMHTTPPRRVAKLEFYFECPHEVPMEIARQLEQGGAQCPVHLSLHPDIIEELHFTWGKNR